MSSFLPFLPVPSLFPSFLLSLSPPFPSLPSVHPLLAGFSSPILHRSGQRRASTANLFPSSSSQWAAPGLNQEHANGVSSAEPQPRDPEPPDRSGQRRAPECQRERQTERQKICQKIIHKIYQKSQKICQKECQKMCQKECQNVRQKECQKIRHKKMSEDMPERMPEDCKKERQTICQKECQKFCHKLCQTIRHKNCQKICQKERQQIRQKEYVRKYAIKSVSRYSDMPERILQNMSGRTSQRMPAGMPDPSPDRMLEHMSHVRYSVRMECRMESPAFPCSCLVPCALPWQWSRGAWILHRHCFLYM